MLARSSISSAKRRVWLLIVIINFCLLVACNQPKIDEQVLADAISDALEATRSSEEMIQSQVEASVTAKLSEVTPSSKVVNDATPVLIQTVTQQPPPTSSQTLTPTPIPSETPSPTATPPNWQIISGPLSQSQTWSGYILVQGDVYVPQGISLTIEPGTVVHFAAQRDDTPHTRGWPLRNCPDPKSELIVDGALAAQGTAVKPILFTSHRDQPQTGDWGGIILWQPASNSTLSHLIVEYADQNLMVHNDSSIEDSIFRYAYGGLVDCPEAKDYDVRVGLTLFSSGAIARNNEMYGNTWGIHANQFPGARSVAITIVGNHIHSNKQTSSGFGSPTGIHVCCANVEIIGNKIEDNERGVAISLGTQALVIENEINSNDIGFSWYRDPAPPFSEAKLCGNITHDNGFDFIEMVSKRPLPEGWFSCQD